MMDERDWVGEARAERIRLEEEYRAAWEASRAELVRLGDLLTAWHDAAADQEREIERLREALAEAKHQLTCLDNLWASDQEDFSHPFKINLTAVLERLDKV